MPKKNEKVEDTAEKIGKSIGTGLKKSGKAVNDFGKGVKKGLNREE